MAGKRTVVKESAAEYLAANVSTLKTHLGRYLKKVKEGQEVTVYDRQTPVARLVPYVAENEGLVITPAKWTWAEALENLNRTDRPRIQLEKSSLEYLQEDRGE